MKDLMAANWKMFKTRQEAREFMEQFTGLIQGKMPPDREIIIFPPFTALETVNQAKGDLPELFLGGQDMYPRKQGAFTGEISPAMLLEAGCSYVLAGHSERRQIFHEDDLFIAQKTEFALDAGLKVILCIGENLEERKQGHLEQVLQRQLNKALQDINREQIAQRLVIAYEPVWAIGTGEVAGPAEISSAHLFVRNVLVDLFADQGEKIRILYGGSVKPENCTQIMGLDNVSGVLVGGASLNAQSFSQIVLA